MGTWYTIGLFAGLGLAVGVLLAGTLATLRAGGVLAAVFAAAVGVALALLLADAAEAVGAGVGGLLGGVGAAQIVRGSVGRGGTRAGTAVLVGAAAVVLAALAFVPVLGYVETVVLPALAVRLRRRAGRTYAGLRILARD